jgi:hypothetical protein
MMAPGAPRRAPTPSRPGPAPPADGSGRRVGVAVLVLALLALHPAPAGRAARDSTGAQAIKDAAVARVAMFAARSLMLDHVDLARVVGDWAVVRIYPKPGLTDPAIVVLRLQEGMWTAVAGPGTAILPMSLPDAPAGLLDFTNPYIGMAARTALAGLSGTLQRYESPQAGFQYPADATSAPGADGPPGAVTVTGPMLTEPPFTGPAYQITVTPLGLTPDVPLDVWGYGRMQEEIARREAVAGPGGPNTRPRGASYYQTETSDVFQIDWFAGDSTQREFYVAVVGGGPIVQLSTRVYPVENNPAAPQAQAAVTLVLQTLRAGPGVIVAPQPPRQLDYTPFAQAWARNGLGLAVAADGTARAGWRFYRDNQVVSEGSATIQFQNINGQSAFGLVLDSTDPARLTPGNGVSLVLLDHGLAIFTQPNTAWLLCGPGFLTAPDWLQLAWPCGYWL